MLTSFEFCVGIMLISATAHSASVITVITAAELMRAALRGRRLETRTRRQHPIIVLQILAVCINHPEYLKRYLSGPRMHVGLMHGRVIQEKERARDIERQREREKVLRV